MSVPSTRRPATLSRQALRQRAVALWGEDRLVSYAVFGFAVVQLFGCLWDLPGSHGWENDGIAPRGLFSGLAESFRQGHAHRYPLFHYLLSIVVSAPALLSAPLVARSLEPAALASAVGGVPVMTAVACSVKLLSIAMSCTSALLLGSFVRRSFGSVAARASVLAFCFNVSLAYYGRTSNLDGPYLFWVTLSLWSFGELDGQPAPGSMARLGSFLALAVATKDQAYAAALPVGCAGIYRAFCCAERGIALRSLLGFAAGSYALASGALFNPSGFVARLHLLSGPNQQDYAVYPRDLDGVLQNLHDITQQLPRWWWPAPVLLLVVLGVLAALFRSVDQRSIMPVLPLLCAASSLLLFTLVVRRAEHRFVLPCALAACCYAGVGASLLVAFAQRLRFVLLARGAARFDPRLAVSVALGLTLALAAVQAASVLATQWGDGRNALARWLRTRSPGTRVETYGLPVYLPHFEVEGATYEVTRVEPAGTRFAVLQGAESLVDSYGNWLTRDADLLLVPEGFAVRFAANTRGPGTLTPAAERNAQRDTEGRMFFRAALAGAIHGYRLAFVAAPTLAWPFRALACEPAQLHGSTGMRTFVFARDRARIRP